MVITHSSCSSRVHSKKNHEKTLLSVLSKSLIFDKIGMYETALKAGYHTWLSVMPIYWRNSGCTIATSTSKPRLSPRASLMCSKNMYDCNFLFVSPNKCRGCCRYSVGSKATRPVLPLSNVNLTTCAHHPPLQRWQQVIGKQKKRSKGHTSKYRLHRKGKERQRETERELHSS